MIELVFGLLSVIGDFCAAIAASAMEKLEGKLQQIIFLDKEGVT